MTAEIQNKLVEFRNVTFAVNGGPPIIDDLNFTVAAGETLVLLGESGCGKTTTLRLVNRLLTPAAGQVLVEGKPTTEWDVIRLRRRTGYVIQEAGLFPHFTVAENVALVPSLENWPEEKTRVRVEELLSLVGLEAARFADRYPRELSGGQRQRVAIARALVNHPSILLADEPTGALDTATSYDIMNLFEKLHEAGNTIIVVTHEHDIAARAHRIISIRDGLIEKDERIR